ncbi:MAG TPA: PQQ-binding-like beta-propeller repeat protein [Candidatus Sulfotelmatobacter sp.]
MLLLCGLIAVLAADIHFWYRVERRPPPYTRQIPRLEWTRAVDPLYLTFTPPLVAKDGTLYVASAGGVHALDASSAERWVYRATESDPIVGGSLSQDDSGNLYFATLHSVYSLSSSGLKRWQADCLRAALARNAAGHAIDGDAIYATCDTHLVALSRLDGHETWSLPELQVQAPSVMPVAPLLLRNHELVFSRDQHIVASDLRGNILWTFPSAAQVTAYFLGSGPDDVIYARKFSGEMLALYFDGTIKWKLDGVGGFNESPVRAADGTLYVVAPQGPLYAIDPRPGLKWKFPLPPSTSVMGYTAPVVAPDGTIYQLLEDRVLAISPNGKLLSELPLPGEPRHRGFLALSADGTLYAVMDNSFLHAIKVGR